MLCSALPGGWSAAGVTSGAERVALVGSMSAASVPVAPSRPWAMLCSALPGGWSAAGVTSGAERVALVGSMSAASVPVAPSRPWAMPCSAPEGTGGAEGGASPDALAAPLARATGVGAGGAPDGPGGAVVGGSAAPLAGAPPRSWVALDDVAASASATPWGAGSVGADGGGSAPPGWPAAGSPSDDPMPCAASEGNGPGGGGPAGDPRRSGAAGRAAAERACECRQPSAERASDHRAERGERTADASLTDHDVGAGRLPPLPPALEEAELRARFAARGHALEPATVVGARGCRAQHLPRHDPRADEQKERHRIRQRLSLPGRDDDERHDDEDDREDDRHEGAIHPPREDRADRLAEHHGVGIRERGRVALEARLGGREPADPCTDQDVVEHHRESGRRGEEEAEPEEARDRVRHDRTDQQSERGAPTRHRDRRARALEQVLEEGERRCEELAEEVLEPLLASVRDETEQDRGAEQPVDAVPGLALRGRGRLGSRIGYRPFELAGHDPHVPGPRDDERQHAEDERAQPVLAEPAP